MWCHTNNTHRGHVTEVPHIFKFDMRWRGVISYLFQPHLLLKRVDIVVTTKLLIVITYMFTYYKIIKYLHDT